MAISRMEELMRKLGDRERDWMVEASMGACSGAEEEARRGEEEDSMILADSHSTSMVDM